MSAADRLAGPRRRRAFPRPWGLAGRRRRTISRPRRVAGRRGTLPRLRRKVVLFLVALILLCGGGWLWLRDSSLVAVNRVTVSGASGPDAEQIRSALIAAARGMTTLDVRMDQLRTAVAPFPVVKDLRISTQFPHGMRIRVVEQTPVGAVVVAGRTIAVAGDDTLLHDVIPAASLPAIPLRIPPGGSRLTDPDATRAVAVLAAAPYPLLLRISEVATVAPHGPVAALRSGPSIYFGDATRLTAKWIAATAVLADPGSAGALYIDVTDPERPVAGASATAAAGATQTAGATSQTAGATSQTAGATSPTAAAGSTASGTTSPTAVTAPSGATSPTAGTPTAGSPTTSTTPPGG